MWSKKNHPWSAYISSRSFNMWMKKILACPYLPLKDVEEYFVELITQSSNDDELSKFSPGINTFADYMTNQWIHNPSIPQKIWNIYDDRTNNCCEIWHAKWYRHPGTSHPNIFKF